jgi:hypothetical protein
MITDIPLGEKSLKGEKILNSLRIFKERVGLTFLEGLSEDALDNIGIFISNEAALKDIMYLAELVDEDSLQLSMRNAIKECINPIPDLDRDLENWVSRSMQNDYALIKMDEDLTTKTQLLSNFTRDNTQILMQVNKAKELLNRIYPGDNLENLKSRMDILTQAVGQKDFQANDIAPTSPAEKDMEKKGKNASNMFFMPSKIGQINMVEK